MGLVVRQPSLNRKGHPMVKAKKSPARPCLLQRLRLFRCFASRPDSRVSIFRPLTAIATRVSHEAGLRDRSLRKPSAATATSTAKTTSVRWPTAFSVVGNGDMGRHVFQFLSKSLALINLWIKDAKMKEPELTSACFVSPSFIASSSPNSIKATRARPKLL